VLVLKLLLKFLETNWYSAELTMGHGSNGSTNLGGSRGSRVSTRDPL